MPGLVRRIISALERIVEGPMTEEEVSRALDKLASEGTERLAWRASVVDLLKLLKLPYGVEERADLAEELGFDGPFKGSTRDNERLHALVTKAIQEHYIHIPRHSS